MKAVEKEYEDDDVVSMKPKARTRWIKNTLRLRYMEAGRDKGNKNKVEYNDPLLLVRLSEAYYNLKQFSESLEIYFEMSRQFTALRQIQIALQGIYSMEQKSAGDVKIL